MSSLPKIPVGERIKVGNDTWLGTPSGPIKLYSSSTGGGGFRVVQALTDRDNLAEDEKIPGMWCYIIDEDMVYKLLGGTWKPWVLGEPLVCEQTAPSTTWEVDHNFGYFPIVTLFDNDGYEFKAEVRHVSVNKVIINLNTPETGRVQLK